MLISENYREMNKQLHETREDYGAGHATAKWIPQILELVAAVQAHSILDYGCGKGALKRALPAMVVTEYDPAIPGKDGAPQPEGFVV